MKKAWVLGILVVIVAVVLIVLFYPSGENTTPLNCGNQGETIDFTDPLTPNECCEGLDDVNVQTALSVADECYWTGMLSGAPIITCSDCGNGICEDAESVCGCAEDCVAKEKSDYNTVQEFCDNDYERYCESPGAIELREVEELDLCALCN